MSRNGSSTSCWCCGAGVATAPPGGELIRPWERRLFYFVRRLVGGERDAWDVLQQTWLAA